MRRSGGRHACMRVWGCCCCPTAQRLFQLLGCCSCPSAQRLFPLPTRCPKCRAQARVDAKDFRGSLADFDAALAQVPPGAADVDRARLLAGAWVGKRWLHAHLRALMPAPLRASAPVAVLTTTHQSRPAAGRGLALEGVGDWAAARDTYTEALRTAQDAGQLPDPYVVNSRGNCQASLGARCCCCCAPSRGCVLGSAAPAPAAH